MTPEKDNEFMRLALAEGRRAFALGEVPVGAVLVVGEQVVATAYNQREQKHDATAHAELIAIREGCGRLGSWRLSEATLYVTLEPCPMCAGAIWASRLKRLVYGASDSQAGAAGSLFNIVDNKVLNHRTEVTAGVCEEECGELLRCFFAQTRGREE